MRMSDNKLKCEIVAVTVVFAEDSLANLERRVCGEFFGHCTVRAAIIALFINLAGRFVHLCNDSVRDRESERHGAVRDMHGHTLPTKARTDTAHTC